MPLSSQTPKRARVATLTASTSRTSSSANLGRSPKHRTGTDLVEAARLPIVEGGHISSTTSSDPGERTARAVAARGAKRRKRHADLLLKLDGSTTLLEERAVKSQTMARYRRAPEMFDKWMMHEGMSAITVESTDHTMANYC